MQSSALRGPRCGLPADNAAPALRPSACCRSLWCRLEKEFSAAAADLGCASADRFEESEDTIDTRLVTASSTWPRAVSYGFALPRASGPFMESQRCGRRRNRSTANTLFEYLRRQQQATASGDALGTHRPATSLAGINAIIGRCKYGLRYMRTGCRSRRTAADRRPAPRRIAWRGSGSGRGSSPLCSSRPHATLAAFYVARCCVAQNMNRQSRGHV
jgi:hypothetical protein